MPKDFYGVGDENRQRLLCIMLGSQCNPSEKEVEKLIDLFSNIQRIMRNVPDRSGEDWNNHNY